MTVVLVKSVTKEQRAEKASAIVAGTHNDRHSIASCCSPWVHSGACLGPALAGGQLPGRGSPPEDEGQEQEWEGGAGLCR